MSAREQCLNIVKEIPDDQLEYVKALLENVKKIIEEAADMAFCVNLSETHKQNNPVFIEEDYSLIEDVASRLGVSLDEV